MLFDVLERLGTDHPGLTSYTEPSFYDSTIVTRLQSVFGYEIPLNIIEKLAMHFGPYIIGQKEVRLCSPAIPESALNKLLTNLSQMAADFVEPRITQSELCQAQGFNTSLSTLRSLFLNATAGMSESEYSMIVKLMEARTSMYPKMHYIFGSPQHSRAHGTPWTILRAELARINVSDSYWEHAKEDRRDNTFAGIVAVYATYLYLHRLYGDLYTDYTLWLAARLTAPLKFWPDGVQASLYAVLATCKFENPRRVLGSMEVGYGMYSRMTNRNETAFHVLYGALSTHIYSLETNLDAAFALKSYADRYFTYLALSEQEAPRSTSLRPKLLTHHLQCSANLLPYRHNRSANGAITLRVQTLRPEYQALRLQGLSDRVVAIHVQDPMAPYDIPFLLGITDELAFVLLTPASRKTKEFFMKVYGLQERSPLAAEHGESLTLTNPASTAFPVVMTSIMKLARLAIPENFNAETEYTYSCLCRAAYVGVTDIYKTFIDPGAETAASTDNNLFHMFELLDLSVERAFAALNSTQEQ